MKKEYHSTNHVPCEFWFGADNINYYVKGSKKKWVLDWPTLPSTWWWKLGWTFYGRKILHWHTLDSNFSKGRHYQHNIDCILCPTSPNPKSHFHVPLNLDAHPNMFCKTLWCSPTTSLLPHHNKWERASHVNGCYVIGVMAIPCPW